MEQHLRGAKKLWASLQKEVEASDRDFLPEQFSQDDKVKISMERTFKFITDADFESLYKVKPGVCGLTSEVLKSETGALISGVLLQDDTWPFRTVRVSSASEQSLSRMHHNAGHQLRPGQGADVAAQCHVEFLKELPLCLQKATPTSLAEIKAKVEESIQREAERAQNPTASVPAPLESTLKKDDRAEAEDGKEEEDEEEEDEALRKARGCRQGGETAVQAFSSGRGRGKAKAKGKMKPETKSSKRFLSPGKLSPRSRTKRRKFDADVDDGRTVISIASTRGPSEGGSTPGSKTKQTDLVAQSLKYKNFLRLSRILAGGNIGQDLNQSRRILSAMEDKMQYNETYLDLSSHLELVAAAQKLSVDSIGSLLQKDREALLEQVFRKLDAIPSEWAVQVIVCYVRDFVPVMQASEVPDYVERIMPVAPEGVEGASLEA